MSVQNGLSHALVVVAVMLGPIAALHAENQPTTYRPISLSLVYPATTFLRTDPIIAGLSLNLLDGGHRAVYGLEVGLVVNRERDQMAGIQVAGVTNVVLGWLRGVQIAGGINIVLRPSDGVQIGGLWNHASSVWTPSETGFQGVQISGLGNSADQMTGLQWSTAVNVAGELQGAQLGFVNVAYLRMDGLQLGFLNLHLRTWIRAGRGQGALAAEPVPSTGRFRQLIEQWAEGQLLTSPLDPFFHLVDVRSHLLQISLVNASMHLVGAQMGGFLNMAVRLEGFQLSSIGNMTMLDAHGAQIAVGYNYAGAYVEGLQLALVNLCDSLRGVQIGVINLCGRMKGAQIGAINIAYRNKVPFLPGLNIGL